jgi:hypothetical protein
MREVFAVVFFLCMTLLMWSAPKNFLWLGRHGTGAFHLLNMSIGLGAILVSEVIPADRQVLLFAPVTLWYLAMLVAAYGFPQEYSTRGMIKDWFKGGTRKDNDQSG